MADEEAVEVEMMTEPAGATSRWVDPEELEGAVIIDSLTEKLDALIQHQGEPITFRRICWPDPDRLCLMGDCGDCNKHPFRALGRIKHYLRHAPVEKRDGLKEAHTYGLDHNFNTAEVWRGDWPKGVSRR